MGPHTFFWMSTYIWPFCVLKNFQSKSGNNVLWQISSHDSYIFVSEVRHAHSSHSQHHIQAASQSTQKPSVHFSEDEGSQNMLEYSAIMAPFVSCANTYYETTLIWWICNLSSICLRVLILHHTSFLYIYLNKSQCILSRRCFHWI